MASTANVLLESPVIPQVRYHAALLTGLERACRKYGKSNLRELMDLSRTGLENILEGISAPHDKRLWDLLVHDGSVLDDLAALYGKRLAPLGSICVSTEKAGTALVAALHKVIEAEADGAINHNELLDMEREVIAAEHALQVLRARIGDIRKPRQVA